MAITQAMQRQYRARDVLTAYLLFIAKGNSYFYIINGDNDHPSSLCHVCGLTILNFNILLVSANLMSIEGNDEMTSTKMKSFPEQLQTDKGYGPNISYLSIRRF